jgi:hypothetical protein
MRLTTKGRFAVTAMIDLALRSGTGPVALAAISHRQQISLSYLEQLFGKLRRHELVESTRGPGGGYSLGPRSTWTTPPPRRWTRAWCELMVPWLYEHFGNPASRSHAYGWEAEEAVEIARAQVAGADRRRPARDRLDQRRHRSNNLAIKGAAHFHSSRAST